jgi:hypothetical protein
MPDNKASVSSRLDVAIEVQRLDGQKTREHPFPGATSVPLSSANSATQQPATTTPLSTAKLLSWKQLRQEVLQLLQLLQPPCYFAVANNAWLEHIYIAACSSRAAPLLLLLLAAIPHYPWCCCCLLHNPGGASHCVVPVAVL